MIKHLCSWAAILSFGSTCLAGAPSGLPIPPSIIKEVETGKPTEPSAIARQNEKIAKLDKLARSTDAEVSYNALRELKGMGAVARPTLIPALKHVLTRDQAAIEAAISGIGDGVEAAKYETEIEALRNEARENIPKLSKEKPETIKKAHEYYDALIPMTERMNQAWAYRFAIIDGMGRRVKLISMWRDVAPADDKSFTPAAETSLRERSVKVVGDILERTSGMEWGKPPKDESLKPIWVFGQCRKIEAWYNSLIDQLLDPEETKNLKRVNQYREAIGLLPYEIDARLVQAARRHSKEMVEKGYFSHESPVEENKSFGKRAANAGYKGAAGENIASGTSSGEGAFNMWFDSPGHHQNMAGGGQAIGIGRFGNRITQVFGGAPRVMLMSEDERSRIKIEGTIVPPQGAKTPEK
jgi:hypothetical protein